MIKIFNSDQIRQGDAFTILHEPISSYELMERAATSCYNWLKASFSKEQEFIIFCGKGNNGGDGLAISRMLLENGFNSLVILVGNEKELSPDCQKNYEIFCRLYPASISVFSLVTELPKINASAIIIDALFGTGLSRSLEGSALLLLDWINMVPAKVISIDIPSGMFADKSPNDVQAKIVQADYTLTFQFPKLSFLLPQSGNSVGKMIVLNIGLDKDFIEKTISPYFYLEQSDVEKMIVKRSPFSHKGNYGHALIVAGSTLKMGAAILCTHACLRSGTGLVTALIPDEGKNFFQSTLPEAMLLSDEEGITTSTDLSKFSSIGIGPGLGMQEKACTNLKLLLQNYRSPIVFDADAINIMAENKTWLGFLSNKTVFTPHLKEFERLVGIANNDFERLELAQIFAKKYATHLVLKGKYTCIICPDGKCYFNSTGNPGMAKGGSGDVLTGIITSFLAQGYAAKDACIMGVYIHGMAGDNAADQFSETAMLAGDIISCLPETFKKLSRKYS